MQHTLRISPDKAAMQLLLDKAAIIKLRLEVLKSENTFNIFQVLRSGHEEVSLHSRFLYELLNPKGSHGMGDGFLRHFVEVCSLPDLSYNTVHVLREHASIDILIRDHNHAIIIENKIYAGDRQKQLQRYHEYLKNLNFKPTLFYLTLDGHEASEQSIGNLLEKPTLISYKTQITQWLTVCIKEAAMKPALRETIIQYQNLINQLTGNTMSEAEKQQVLSLIAQVDNAESAAIIVRNWNHIRWHTEWDFWTDLLALAETKFQVSDDSRFTEGAISKHVHGGNNKDWWYGLVFSVGKLFGNDVTFKIERGEEEAVYYGFLHCSTDHEVREQMRNVLLPLEAQSNDDWAGWKYTASGIDFYTFDKSITLQLASKNKRQQIIGELWQEIQDFISKSTTNFQAEFGSNFISASNLYLLKH